MLTIRLPRFSIGTDAFDAFAPEIGSRGKSVAVIHGEKAWKAAKAYVLPALQKAGLTVTGCILYGKDATWENVHAICARPEVRNADCLLAVGGGKCLDTVKLAADQLNKPVFTVPTIASNCAPVTQISIIYNADGSFREIPRLNRVPEHCLLRSGLRILSQDICDDHAFIHGIFYTLDLLIVLMTFPCKNDDIPVFSVMDCIRNCLFPVRNGDILPIRSGNSGHDIINDCHRFLVPRIVGRNDGKVRKPAGNLSHFKTTNLRPVSSAAEQRNQPVRVILS